MTWGILIGSLFQSLRWAMRSFILLFNPRFASWRWFLPGWPQVAATGVGVLLHSPVVVVDLVVTRVTQQHQVVGLGGSAVLPFDDVVRDAPFGFDSAADAAPISGFQGGPESEVGMAASSTQPDGLGVGFSE